MRTIGKFLEGRDNNFNLLRIVLASLVIYGHSFSLSLPLVASPAWYERDLLLQWTGITSGTLAVRAFFVLSGFLVAQSLFYRRYIPSFLAARALRIYPGLIVCVLFCALVVGPWFTSVSLSEYFTSSQVARFILDDASLLRFYLQDDLPGVFLLNPSPGHINGSLWTLPWEWTMYLSLAVLGLLGLLDRRRFLLFAWTCALVIHAWTVTPNYIKGGLMGMLINFLAYFYAGAILFLWREKIAMTMRTLVVAVLLLVLISGLLSLSRWMNLIFIPLLAYCLIGFALLPSGSIRAYNQLGDYSYGTYIYGFPVQQSIVAVFPIVSPMELLSLALMLTFLLAVISWKWIEQPMLERKESVFRFLERLREKSHLNIST